MMSQSISFQNPCAPDQLVREETTVTAHIFRLQLRRLKKDELKVEIIDGESLCISCDRGEVVNKKIQMALAKDARARDTTAVMSGDTLIVTVPKRQGLQLPTGQRIGRMSVEISD